MPLYVLLFALSAGGDPAPSVQNTPIDVHDGVQVTPEQLQDVKSKAAQAFSGEIERIYVGRLAHPSGNSGFRVHFKDEIVETYVIKRAFILEITSGIRDNRNSAKGKLAGRRDGLRTSVERLFPLTTAELHLRLPDALSYRQTMSLLQAIESKTYRVRPNTLEVENLNAPIDTSKITFLSYDQKAKTIEVFTSITRTSGACYTFAVLPDGFELLRVSLCVS